jgi:hypothetical protein
MRPRSLKVFFIVAAFLINLLVATFWPNLGCSIVASCLFTVAVVWMFNVDPGAMWLLFPVALTQLSVLLSLNVIDSGAYMIEMGQFARPSPAAAVFACYSLVFLLTSFFMFRRLKRGDKSAQVIQASTHGTHPIFQWAIVSMGMLCVLYLLIAGLRTGFPLLTGTDRFVYRRLYADVLTVNILDLKLIPPAILGAMAAFSQIKPIRILSITAFVGLMALSFLYGDKFFIIIVSVSSFVLPLILKSPRSAVRTLAKLTPLIAIGGLCVLSVTYLIYSDYGARSSDDTFARLGDRVAGQGELWSVAVEYSSKWINFDHDIVYQNLASTVAKNSQDYAFDYHLGALYFVEKYSPPAMYRSFQHSKGFVTPTAAYEAYGLVAFGYIGLAVLMVVTGLFVSWVMFYFYRTVVTFQLFAVLLSSFIMNQTVKFLSQAALYALLSVGVLKAYIAFFILQLLVSGASRGLSSRKRLDAQPGEQAIANGTGSTSEEPKGLPASGA